MKPYLFIIIFLWNYSIQAQTAKPYKVSLKKDLPLTTIGLSTFIAGNLLLNQIESLSEDQVMQFEPGDINKLDRSAIDNYSPEQGILSDYAVALAAVSPAVVLLDEEARNNFLSVLVMTTQVVTFNVGITTIVKSMTKRPRPYVYNNDVELNKKLRPYTRFSFFSAHTSNAASLSFFTASLVSAYSQNKTVKTLVWSGAISLPLITGYLRYSSGNHYPTDVIAGYIWGASIGYLVPLLHKVNPDDRKFVFQANGTQFSLKYLF